MSAGPTRLPAAEWLSAGETNAVVAALVRAGAAVRFVGGCVRDTLIGRPVSDVDLATPFAPRQVIAALEAAGVHALPTGIEHGTITAVAGRKHFEITTLRRDVETDGRRAVVAFTDDWTEDAARRDFTINALSADPDGTVHDPFGGLADLSAGRVRFVGDPALRIREDVLRLLRFFRFQAHYGKGAPDAAGLAACRALAPLLPGLSGERIAGETIKLLRARDPAAVVALMLAEGIWQPILPQLRDVARLAGLVRVEALVAAPDAIRRLAALLPDDKAAAADVAARLRLSNAEAERVAALAAPAVAVDADMADAARRRDQRRAGSALYGDLVLLAWARADVSQDAAWRALFARVAAWTPPQFPLRGRDALAAGVPAGPQVGRVLAAVEAWWESGDFRADRAACLEKLGAVARAL